MFSTFVQKNVQSNLYHIQKNRRMYSVVTVIGMVSHVIHSTKGQVLAVISTCNQVNKNFLVKQSPFLIMYLILTYYIFTRWSDRGLQFSEIPRGDVIGYRSRFNNMHNEEVEPFVFCFIYSNINYIVFKITNTSYFFNFIGCLIEVWNHFCQKMDTRIPVCGVFVSL